MLPTQLTNSHVGQRIAADATSGTITTPTDEYALANTRIGGTVRGVFVDDGITYVSVTNGAGLSGVFALNPHEPVSIR